MSSAVRIAVVTGGNRGIGRAIVEGLARERPEWTILFTCRQVEDGSKALEAFHAAGLKSLHYHQLDVADNDSIKRFCESVLAEHGRVDVLINNAGIFKDWGQSILKTDLEVLDLTYRTNTLGPLKLIQAFVPGMIERNWGRVINMSSGAGQLSEMNGKHLAYRISKSGLNTITRVLADEVKDKNILVNSMCPGFVKTDMTGGEHSPATRTPEQGADTAIWLATLPDDGPRGGFFRDRKPLAW